jgi:AraC family transcriptional activator of pobA
MRRSIPILEICTLSGVKDSDLVVERFSSYLKRHKDIHSPHRHNFYHMVLFTKGEGFHSIDFNRFLIEPYQIYFMIPGQVHSWNFEDEVDGYVVNFSADFFQSFLLRADYLESFSFFNGIAEDGVINLNESLKEPVQYLFEDMLTESSVDNSLQKDIIRVILLRLFLLLKQQNLQKDIFQQPSYTLLRNFQKLIEKHYRELRLPKDYADLLFVTPNHLNALCKSVTGMQAGELIRNRILLEAKRLLVNQDLSIAEISNELNFNDNSYFTRFFKKQIGLTPEEFRRTIIEPSIS